MHCGWYLGTYMVIQVEFHKLFLDRWSIPILTLSIMIHDSFGQRRDQVAGKGRWIPESQHWRAASAY